MEETRRKIWKLSLQSRYIKILKILEHEFRAWRRREEKAWKFPNHKQKCTNEAIDITILHMCDRFRKIERQVGHG